MTTANGRFVWFDLMTTDLEGAKRFYSQLIGWGDRPGPGEGYRVWAMGDREVGGYMALPAEEKKAGAPPQWLGYVAVENVDATVERARKLGGGVHVPGTDIPNIGRFAVLTDPQGAAFGVLSTLTSRQAPDLRALGNTGWSELNTTDWESAWRFYSELFGWKETGKMNMGPEFGDYFMFGPDKDTMLGGMSNAATMMKAPAHWLYYVNVKSVDETAKVIPALGGKVLNGPMEVPGGDRIAQCMDPQGGMFAIFSTTSARP